MSPFVSNSTIPALAEGLAAVICFAAWVLPAGYLASHLAVPDAPQGRGRAERLLWTVAMGLPLSVLACVLGGRVLSQTLLNSVFLALAFGAVCTWAWRRQKAGLRRDGSRQPDRYTRAAAGLALLFGIYCLVETVDVQLGRHLYLSTVLADWSVRVAMVRAAMRSGAPPINGLSTLSAGGIGHAPPLRYYYYWYVEVAQVARVCRLGAQPALAASCVWAGWGFLAVSFLSLKYVMGIRERLRPKCLVLLFTMAILGLDILPTAWLWLSRSHHPYPEMEWWHQDRTPSFLGAVLYAPHHIAAICSLMAGFLVLLRLATMERTASRRSKLRTGAAVLFAGCAFAAAAGLSIFPTFCFAVVLSLWGMDLLRRREWAAVLGLAAAGIIALLLSHAYLRELSSGSSAAAGLVNFAWRNDAFVAGQIARTARFRLGGLVLPFLLRQPVVLLLDVFELGFFLLVLVEAVRQDLFTRDRLSLERCAWWALLLGAGIPALFLTSTATSGPNDLGVDAGFLVRLALQLRAVEWLWKWSRAESGKPTTAALVHRPWGRRAAGALILLGLAAQAYQVLSIRFYFPLVASSWVQKQMDALTRDRLGTRLYDIRAALETFDHAVPPSRPDTEAIQFNPVGMMMPAEVYFDHHQIASWDTGCGTSYGGDYKACPPVFESLLLLFGNTEAGVQRGRAQNDRQDAAAARVATAADLAITCHDLKLRAVMAESTDSIWKQPASWVWTGPAIVANSTVRIIGCPAGSWRP